MRKNKKTSDSRVTLWELKERCLNEINNCESEEKRKQWENALKSAEDLLKELEQ